MSQDGERAKAAVRAIEDEVRRERSADLTRTTRQVAPLISVQQSPGAVAVVNHGTINVWPQGGLRTFPPPPDERHIDHRQAAELQRLVRDVVSAAWSAGRKWPMSRVWRLLNERLGAPGYRYIEREDFEMAKNLLAELKVEAQRPRGQGAALVGFIFGCALALAAGCGIASAATSDEGTPLRLHFPKGASAEQQKLAVSSMETFVRLCKTGRRAVRDMARIDVEFPQERGQDEKALGWTTVVAFNVVMKSTVSGDTPEELAEGEARIDFGHGGQGGAFLHDSDAKSLCDVSRFSLAKRYLPPDGRWDYPTIDREENERAMLVALTKTCPRLGQIGQALKIKASWQDGWHSTLYRRYGWVEYAQVFVDLVPGANVPERRFGERGQFRVGRGASSGIESLDPLAHVLCGGLGSDALQQFHPFAAGL